jgi:hypothetical protein
MGKKKPAAAAKRAPAADWRDTAAVRVRMYRHGLGDCFLLSFPRARKRDYQVLIDCGIILGTPEGEDHIARVVKSLQQETANDDEKPTIDVLVATHEHWDHLSAFATAQLEFKKFDIGQVWAAWTEDPKNDTANQLRSERAAKLKALQMGVAHLKLGLGATGALGADGETGPAAADFRRTAEVLTFWGIDPDHPLAGLGDEDVSRVAASVTAFGVDPAGVDSLRATDKQPKLGIKDAMKWCVDRPATQRLFCKPGEVIEPDDAIKGLRVYVLGPPTDKVQLLKDLPTKKGKETYEEDEKTSHKAAGRAFFGADVGQAQPDRARAEFERATPFGQKYRISMDEAGALDFFREHYFGIGSDDHEAWRRIDGSGLDDAAEFALQLDSDTNNTSLALAFELADGRVLLFPGDAQVGNWESWHADSKGVKQEWEAGRQKVTAEELLGRTVVYKVGHHGSHNATLRGQGLEMMTDVNRLVALVPVDTYIAHEKKHWGKMPFDPLMKALEEKTQGRVIIADRPIADMPPKVFAAGAAVDSPETITVAGKDKPVTRPLYVDYFVPKE